MRNYELTVVVDGKATPAKKKAFLAKLEKLVETFKGKLGKLEDWGEKPLAYKIKKPSSPAGGSTSGIFMHFPVELEGNAAKSLSTKLEQDDEIIRYLLVREENPPWRKASAR